MAGVKKRLERRAFGQARLSLAGLGLVVLFIVLAWCGMQRQIDPISNFEYAEFWSSANSESAFWSREEVGLDKEEPACPKVYIYELSTLLTDWSRRENRPSVVKNEIYVPESAVDENGNLLEVILDKLLRSERCRTRNFREASLFLVPILPKSKHWSEWSKKCQKISDGAGGVRGLMLPYLTQKNARHHFFIFPRVGYMPKCAGWWATPISDPRLIDFARIAVGGYEEFSGDFQRGKTLAKLSTKQRKEPQMLIPRLISAPYVANVRFLEKNVKDGKKHIWMNTNQTEKRRSFLYHYAGTPHGSDKATRLRALLQTICLSQSKHCLTNSKSRKSNSFRDTKSGEWSHAARLDATLAMRNATFCLEPPGLTPGRSSILTGLLLGCIPVFFAKEQDSLWPLHLGGWLDHARLFINADHILSAPNPADFLYRTLLAVPHTRIAAMQEAIRAHAHRLQYAYNDMPGDALEVLLRGILAAASTLVPAAPADPTSSLLLRHNNVSARTTMRRRSLSGNR